MADKQTVKSPVTKGVAKVPVIMQLEALECGAACLTMILAYYGKWIPLAQVREDCGVSRDGSNARNVMRAGKNYGLEAAAYRIEARDMAGEISFPCIIHWDFNHFIVLDGFKGGKVYLNDPAKGDYSLSMDVFEKHFTGICIEFRPTERFVPSGKPESTLEFARKRLKGTGTAIAFTVLILIISSLMSVISPAFSRVFMDELLPGKNPGWTTPYFIMLIVFTLVQLSVSFYSTIYQLRITGKMAAVGNTEYMWKVLHMPMNFFSQRMAADIQERQSENADIAGTLINTLAPLVINTGMMVFYFVVMLRYNVWLTLIGIGNLTLNAVVARAISKRRVNLTRVAVRDKAQLSSATLSGIGMIETIKAGGAENGFFARWAGLQAKVNTNDVRSLKLDTTLGSIPGLLTTLADSAVMVLGVWLAIEGEFTVGMIMAFQGLLTSFFSPAQTLIGAGQTIQEMRTDMERINDVMDHEEDRIFAENVEGEARKLTGNIELKDVTFGYSPLAAPVISGISLTVKPGDYIAIVGSSGCGKSTIAKLISGLYMPRSGEILFDGKKLSEIDGQVFRSSVAVVDQDIILFEDTIANNIKMWDGSIEDFEMILAARDAQIHDDIMARPDGYKEKIIDGGRNFSGGQRQRIEIARALAQDPTIIVLDEATSALDAKTEYELVKAIRDRGITCLVVAHRLSTIRSCDNIIVLDHGTIAASGTHSQLMESCSIYRELVTAE